MAKSIQAQAAAQIRKKMKEAGFKANVTSFQASMCDGVRIYCQESDLAKAEQIDEICKPYQYGHFNGMEDIYEYSSIIPGLPQVKFVQISYSGCNPSVFCSSNALVG